MKFWAFIYEFERRHPWAFGILLALAIVVLYATVDDSAALFILPGSTT